MVYSIPSSDAPVQQHNTFTLDRDQMDDKAAGTGIDKAADVFRELTLSGKHFGSYYKEPQLSSVVRSKIK